MVSGREKFGAFIRREREAKEIGLREMAKMIGVSPTYLSKVERDEFPPPAEDKVRTIAEIIGQRCGRIAGDGGPRGVRPGRHHPRAPSAKWRDFLRAAKGLTAEDMARLARQAQKAKDK